MTDRRCRFHPTQGVIGALTFLMAVAIAVAPAGATPGNGNASGHDKGDSPTTTSPPTVASPPRPVPTGNNSSSGNNGGGSNHGQTPSGNNGHIMIDKFNMDGSGNEPHVACGFSVSFFGYDAGTQHATITVTPQTPTAGGHFITATTSWTTAQRTGGNQFDANVRIGANKIATAFAGLTPDKQGFHARIDVHVTGSQGADGKHKMVWITRARCHPRPHHPRPHHQQ